MKNVQDLTNLIEKEWISFIKEQHKQGIEETFLNELEKSKYFKKVYLHAIKRGFHLCLNVISEGEDND